MTTEIEFCLTDGPVQENEFASVAWLDLCGYLKEACESLNKQQTYADVEISRWDSVRWMHDLRDRAELCYLRNPGHAYWLEISFDFSSHLLRYSVTGLPLIELEAFSDGEGLSAFRTSAGEEISPRELHFAMLDDVLSRKPF